MANDSGMKKKRHLGKASGIKLAPAGHHKTRQDRQDEAKDRYDPDNTGAWVHHPAFEQGRRERRERHAHQDMTAAARGR